MTTTAEFDRCPDCDTPIGQRHRDGCDVARCHYTGRQMLSCYDMHPEMCYPDTFTGWWPGDAFARRMGWFIQGTNLGDLNKLYMLLQKGQVRWDPETEDFELVAR